MSWRWRLWILYVLAWTTALLVPVPDHGHWDIGDTEFDLKFAIGKGLHISAYVVMTALTAWLHAPMRIRFFLMFFLMVHATFTEMMQLTMDVGRSGELFDVGLDHIGIAIGMFLTWSWWAQPDSARSLTPRPLAAAEVLRPRLPK
jgi:VanZ family protein